MGGPVNNRTTLALGMAIMLAASITIALAPHLSALAIGLACGGGALVGQSVQGMRQNPEDAPERPEDAPERPGMNYVGAMGIKCPDCGHVSNVYAYACVMTDEDGRQGFGFEVDDSLLWAHAFNHQVTE